MIQDNSREEYLRELFGLKKGGGNERIGTDAEDELGNSYELKSTTINCISAARGVNTSHFTKWRHSIWICGRGEEQQSGFQFKEIYVLMPHELEEWIAKQEDKMLSDLRLVQHIPDLIKDYYSPEELARIEFLVNRGCRPAGALSFSWSYVQEHGTKIEDNHPQKLKDIVSQKGEYLKDKKLHYITQKTSYGGTRIIWELINKVITNGKKE